MDTVLGDSTAVSDARTIAVLDPATDESWRLAALWRQRRGAGRDAGGLLDVVERLECGVIGVNDGAPSTPQTKYVSIVA